LSGLYTLYSKKLEKDIRSGDIPNHIAIILDGNRRWAKRNLMLKIDGHFHGADAVEKLLDWCEELNIKIITLYVLSADNLARNDEELQYLYDLINKRLEKLYNDPRIHKNRMRIKAMGRIELLPDFLKEILHKLEMVTKDYDNHYLNIAIAYGGQHELVDAVKKIAVKIKTGSLDVNEIDKNVIESCLYTSHLPQSSPDMILRTSGEKRLSGFLMWQSAYSELVFMDVYWPEFRKIDLMRAIRTFQKRSRRLGK
jgi:tritrans,polycis-undecaprenyl-diphosphate synthase [geranylgeranyl-diphosphate specific]